MTRWRQNVPSQLRGIDVIDVDTHLAEPHDLWTSRAPAKFRDRVPRVVEVDNPGEHVVGYEIGSDLRWIAEDDIEMGLACGASVIDRDNMKVKGPGFVDWGFDDISPAAWSIDARLDLMDQTGIAVQILYPNIVGFGADGIGAKIDDPDLRDLCCTIWNDAMVEILEESGGRIHGMALLPYWDPEGCVAEIERVHALGLKGVNITSDPQNTGMPDLADEIWDPVWDACESLGLPVNFHVGGSATQVSWWGQAPWPSASKSVKLALGSSMLYLANARVIGNLLFSGICERHPDLKFVSVESGIGWIPFTLDALDYQADENAVDHLSMKPSEYFDRQIYACFWFESNDLLEDLRRLGYDKCMFETDFPHPTCLYPDALTEVSETLSGLDFEDRKKVLSTNAARVYNLDLPT